MGARRSAAAAGLMLVLGGCGTAGAVNAAGPSGVPSAAGAVSAAGPSGVPSAAPTLCAEFPPRPPIEGDLEGWWNGTPADAGGKVLTDPASWPALVREHPRTALIDAASGRVISTWDRQVCGPIPGFIAPQGLTGDVLVLVDADTGTVLGM